MSKIQPNLITSFEAAKKLGISADYVRRLILKGKIKAIKLGHNWVLDPKQLSKVRRKRFPIKKESASNGSHKR